MISKYTESELRTLIKEGENNAVEFKIAPPRPSELAERFCGMANGQGGLIIFGVADETLEIVGLSDISSAIDTILRACRTVQPRVILDPSDPEVYNLDGKKIIVATVPPNSGPVYQSGAGYWIRRGTHTVPLSLSEMLEIINDRGLIKWELRPAPRATMEDIDLEKVKAYLNQRNNRNRREQVSRFDNLEEVLVGMQCVVVAAGGELKPTNAGILFFGKDPQFYLPQSEVVCVLYKDELGIGRYVDRWIIRGTIQELIDETETFLNRYIPVGARIEGWKRIDLPDYPIEALREAVVNAVVHRDYSREGESIRLFYYSDRVEIHSPGLLLPGITISQMERGEVVSRLRNPVMANLLRDIPGYMERIGSGIRLMINETRRVGLPAPQFKEIDEFLVVFRKFPGEADRGTVKKSPSQQDEFGEVLDAVVAVLNKEEASKAEIPTLEQVHKERLVLAMRYVQENGRITTNQLAPLIGTSQRTALRYLTALVSQGALKMVGNTRSRYYKLP